MDGWSARAVPVARGEFRLSLFPFLSLCLISVAFSFSFLALPLPVLSQRLFGNLLAIERLGEGGARQSTRWMNLLRRMQIRTRRDCLRNIASDNSTPAAPWLIKVIATKSPNKNSQGDKLVWHQFQLNENKFLKYFKYLLNNRYIKRRTHYT